ncbi:ribonuclease Y [Candidatus Parcubacteria bacterium]|nr:MAG: ribonuclease Y [Candidatus Parcubacteria bacterium]GIW68790.1 MAG: ribonuclease Y [Candidatus Parcubacteria bacterium]
MSFTILLAMFGALLVGGVVGYVLRWAIALSKRGSMELEIKQRLLEAKEEASKIVERAETEAQRIIDERLETIAERERSVQKLEERLLAREEALDKRLAEHEAAKKTLTQEREALEADRASLRKAQEEMEIALERVAGMTRDEALKELYAQIEREYEEDIAKRLYKLAQEGEERFERKAQEILTSVIHRLGNSVAPDVMSTVVPIPSDDIKGKIIGKEGRNIKAFERATGVEVVIDDAPGTIMISSFDPIRRQIARVALENLILDGRIQPARIEEVVEKAKEEINKIIKQKGEEAAYEAGVFNLNPKTLMILGRLYFRTSYGQNVLQHSVEVALLAGMLAEELGADVQIAKAAGLVHDIGKALDHEVQGSHVEIGRKILMKFGEDERIIKAMQAHHEEYPYETVESVIVQVADAISGGRPGARRDSVEQYIKRLEDLEAIATSFEGVQKAYALSAGREVRVFVQPEAVSDVGARTLARNIAKRIEDELRYPGEIKVHVIRENRIVEYAR